MASRPAESFESFTEEDSGVDPGLLAILPPDAPPGHLAWTRCRYDATHVSPLVSFNGKTRDGGKIHYQTTLPRCADSVYVMFRISRNAYVRFADEGEGKDSLIAARNELYDQISRFLGNEPKDKAAPKKKADGESRGPGRPPKNPASAGAASTASSAEKEAAALEKAMEKEAKEEAKKRKREEAEAAAIAELAMSPSPVAGEEAANAATDGAGAQPEYRGINRNKEMDVFTDATQEEWNEFPDVLYTFHEWMIKDNMRNPNTCRSYLRQLAQIFEEDGKSPKAMATAEYLAITKASVKNKSGNGQRAAAVRLLTQFWELKGDGPFMKTDGSRLFSVKPRPGSSNGVSGSLPNGAKTEVKSETKVEPKVEDRLRRLPLSEVVTMLSEAQKQELALALGRDPSQPLAQRLNGLYVRQENIDILGLPVYEKFGSSKPTFLFPYEKTGGQWRFHNAPNSEAKGSGYAMNKDMAERPWLVNKPWKVSEGGKFEQDTNFEVRLLDLANLPANIEIEIADAQEADDGQDVDRKRRKKENGGSEVKSEAQKKAKHEAKKEAKEKVPKKEEVKNESKDSSHDSSQDSSSSSSSDSADESDVASEKATAAAGAAASAAESVRRFGRVAAKRSVRSGLRCYAHYVVRCADCRVGG